MKKLSKIKLIFAATLLATVLCFTACGQGDNTKNAESSKDTAAVSTQSSTEQSASQTQGTAASSVPQDSGGSSATTQPGSQVSDKGNKGEKSSSQTSEKGASEQKSSAGSGTRENEKQKTESQASQNDNTKKTEPVAAPETTAPRGSYEHGDNAEVRFDEL